MKIRENVWVVRNELNKARLHFWEKIEEVGKNRQDKILTNGMIFTDTEMMINYMNIEKSKKKIKKELKKKLKKKGTITELNFVVNEDGTIELGA